MAVPPQGAWDFLHDFSRAYGAHFLYSISKA